MVDDLSLLGKTVAYPKAYDSSLLEFIPRQQGREGLGLKSDDLPFHGFDIWNCYELSWLNLQGKPISAIGSIRIPASTAYMVESKSLKLYLNSFNQTRFKSLECVVRQISSDLEKSLGDSIVLDIQTMGQLQNSLSQNNISHVSLSGGSLDELTPSVEYYQRTPSLLRLKDEVNSTIVSETWWTHAFKSNCPVTDQPDWATLIIRYEGPEINPESLLLYLISFRNESEFHEHCVEQIFMDISARLAPQKLSVYARYLRRGGIDINPFRSNFEDVPEDVHVSRQ